MTDAPTPPYPGPARAWAFMAVLFVASILSVIDRAILNIVVDPVKADLALSDVQISLLQGLAFGVFYAVVGLPLGLIADRYSRRWLIFAGMALWSCATLAAGLAQSFAAMFAARLMVGLGEAALAPAAISLIGDLFPPDRRGRPISVFLMGQAIAIGLSVSVAGSILQAVRAGRFRFIAAFDGLAPWRVVFVCCGLAGALILGAVLALREPERRSARRADDLGLQARACVAYMARNGAVFAPFYLGFALCFAAAYGIGSWAPTMLFRGFHASAGQLARWLGPLSLVGGVLGPLLGGLLIDWNARRGARERTFKLATLVVASLLAIPWAFAVFAPGLVPAIVLVAISQAVTALIGTTTFAALQTMVPSDMRGVSIALTGLVNTLIGATLGPLLVAEFTQHLYRNPALVGYSIATLAAPALLLAAGCFAVALAALRRQLGSDGEIGRLTAT